MITWITKQFFNVFGNQASLYVFGALIIWAGWAGYNWLQKHDAEIVAREEAKVTQLRLDQASAARDSYAESVDEMMINKDKDEKAIVALQKFKQTQGALVNEAIKQLSKINGGDCVIATNRQRVLAITFQQLEAIADLPNEGNGAATGLAITRLRNLLLSDTKRNDAVRESDSQ